MLGADRHPGRDKPHGHREATAHVGGSLACGAKRIGRPKLARTLRAAVSGAMLAVLAPLTLAQQGAARTTIGAAPTGAGAMAAAPTGGGRVPEPWPSGSPGARGAQPGARAGLQGLSPPGSEPPGRGGQHPPGAGDGSAAMQSDPQSARDGYGRMDGGARGMRGGQRLAGDANQAGRQGGPAAGDAAQPSVGTAEAGGEAGISSDRTPGTARRAGRLPQEAGTITSSSTTPRTSPQRRRGAGMLAAALAAAGRSAGSNRSASPATPGSTTVASPAPPASPAPTTTAATGTAPSPALSQSAGAPSSPGPAAAPAATAPPPRVSSQAGQRASSHRHGRNGAISPGVSAALAEPAAVGLAAASVSAGDAGSAAAASGPATPSRPSARPRQRSQRTSPVFVTVEHIVGVVPGTVWLMMGVLAALSLGLAASSWLSTLRARRLARQRRRLADDVGLLQAALLPVIPEWLGPLRASAAYRPADGPGAGGDFYDLFTLASGNIAAIIGDVSGHGRGALPQTALMRYTLRAYLDSGLSPRAALRAAGAALEHQLGEDCYATVALATYDPDLRTLTYSCAGHPPPLVIGSEAVEPVLASSAPPIGLGLTTGRRQTVIWLPGAAQICLFTDGVVEARSGQALFGAARLARALSGLGARVSAEGLLESVAAQTDRRPDDMAACVLSVDGAAGLPVLRREELELDEGELSSGRLERFLCSCGLEHAEVEETVRKARAALYQPARVLLRVLVPPTLGCSAATIAGGTQARPTIEIERRPRLGARRSPLEWGSGTSLGSTLMP